MKVSQWGTFQEHSLNAVAKTIQRYDETVSHEDLHRKGRPRVTSAAEDKFIKVTSLRNYSPNKCFRVPVTDISTSTVQRRLCESGLHGWITAKKPLLKDTNKKRLAWVKKHEQCTLDWWESALWSDESKFESFGSNHRVFVRCRVGERIISVCVNSTVKHGGGGVIVWGCFGGDTLNQHGYHSILQQYAIPSVIKAKGGYLKNVQS